jgi:transcriptional regulator with XRE-family HTH domain
MTVREFNRAAVNPERIGAAIKAARVAAGLSQGEVAAICTGMDHSHVSRIERGFHTPTLQVLERICSAIGVRVSELFVEVES